MAYGVQGGQQAGYANVAGVPHACEWSGTSASWVDLNPSGATQSDAADVQGGHQVGEAFMSGNWRASLWAGTAASWVNLNPVDAPYSHAFGVDHGQQVGDSGGYAGMWSGTPESFVSLNPAGAIGSNAFGGDGRQVGQAFVDGVLRASLWTGTAESWVDLNPAGATRSVALSVSSAHQVGWAVTAGSVTRASLWSGSASSWVDLTPAGATQSEAYGVDGDEQVGRARTGGSTEIYNRACLWHGTAARWVNLHAFLSGGFTWSEARGIWHDAGITYVVGTAVNTNTGVTQAVMWVSAPPTSVALNGGALEAGLRAWPNPFEAQTTLRFANARRGRPRERLRPAGPSRPDAPLRALERGHPLGDLGRPNERRRARGIYFARLSGGAPYALSTKLMLLR
jgi:hypothetical protein